MKKRMDACLLFAAAIGFTARAAFANVIVNGDFEGGTYVDPTTGDVLPSGWTLGPPSPATLSKVNVTSTVNPAADLGPESGANYMRFQSPADNGTWDCLLQDLNTLAGRQYSISFWVADTSTSVGNTVGLHPVWDENTGNQSDMGDDEFYYAPTNTAPVAYQFFSFTKNASTNLTRIDFHGIDANGSILLDNINAITSESWTNAAGNGLWNGGVSSNWYNGLGMTAFHTGDNVVFDDTNLGGTNYNVTLNSFVNPGSILVNNSAGNYVISGSGNINGTGSLTKSGSGSLTLNTTNTYTGGTNVYGGTLIIGATGALPNAAVSVGAAGKVQLAISTKTTPITSLSIAPGGIFDLTNNAVAVNFGAPANDPVATIKGYLAAGYNAGAWTGTGIVSSTAATVSPGQTLSVGYADGNTDSNTAAGPNQILVKYTLAGDANLDGLVNFTDLLTVVQNFNKPGTDWAHGNFEYGISTNFADLLLVVQNFNKILTPAGSTGDALGGTTLPLGQTVQIQPTVVRVPEPGGAAIMALGAALSLGRRRRKDFNCHGVVTLS